MRPIQFNFTVSLNNNAALQFVNQNRFSFVIVFHKNRKMLNLSLPVQT